jgi:hypothetical protein
VYLGCPATLQENTEQSKTDTHKIDHRQSIPLFKELGAFALTIDIDVSIKILLPPPTSLPLKGSMANPMHLKENIAIVDAISVLNIFNTAEQVC